MTFNPDDPKYTAYVLGELNDADRAAVDAEDAERFAVGGSSTKFSDDGRLAARAAMRNRCQRWRRDQHANNCWPPRMHATVSRKSRAAGSVAWAMAISASLLLAAGTRLGFARTRTLDERANRNGLPATSMKQIGDPATKRTQRDTGTRPSESSAVGPQVSSATRSSEIEFRQAGIDGPSAPQAVSTRLHPRTNITDSADSHGDRRSDQQFAIRYDGINREDTAMGGHGVTNFALRDVFPANMPGLGYGGSGTAHRGSRHLDASH